MKLRILPGPLLNRPRAAETEEMEPREEQEAGNAEVNRVLQIHVVDRAPRLLAADGRALRVERDHVLAHADADDGVVLDDVEREEEIPVAALRRSGLVLVHVRDRAETIDVR